jgi:hypothetical protein
MNRVTKAIDRWYTRCRLYHLNPCDFETIIPGVGPALAKLYRLTETGCPCCSGVRVVGLMLIAFGVGYVV